MLSEVYTYRFLVSIPKCLSNSEITISNARLHVNHKSFPLGCWTG